MNSQRGNEGLDVTRQVIALVQYQAYHYQVYRKTIHKDWISLNTGSTTNSLRKLVEDLAPGVRQKENRNKNQTDHEAHKKWFSSGWVSIHSYFLYPDNVLPKAIMKYLRSS